MAVPFLTLLCFLPSLLATPVDQGTSQSMNMPVPATSLLTLPVQRLNLSATARDMGCFTPKPWVETNKADCEAAVDLFIKDRQGTLGVSHLFSRHETAYMSRVVLPYTAWHGSCYLHIDVSDRNDDQIMSMGEVYAEVMGPNGLVKNCVGQTITPALGGRIHLGRLWIAISSRKDPLAG